MPLHEPRTIERNLRSTGPPGAELLARLGPERLDTLLRETESAPCPSPLIDARLKALGVTKMGHRLKIQGALREARKHSELLQSPTLESNATPILQSNATPMQAATRGNDQFQTPTAAPTPPPFALADLTNSLGRVGAPTPKRAAIADARAALVKAEATLARVAESTASTEAEPMAPLLAAPVAPAGDECSECVLESNEFAPDAAAAASSASSPKRARSPSMIVSLTGKLLRLPGRAIGMYIGLWLFAFATALHIGLGVAGSAAARLPIGSTRAVSLVAFVRDLTGSIRFTGGRLTVGA